jgi:hypothetical protein
MSTKFKRVQIKKNNDPNNEKLSKKMQFNKNSANDKKKVKKIEASDDDEYQRPRSQAKRKVNMSALDNSKITKNITSSSYEKRNNNKNGKDGKKGINKNIRKEKTSDNVKAKIKKKEDEDDSSSDFYLILFFF